jgi:hypothetical protein
MEERIEYAGQSTGRRGKTFIGGYIDNIAAERLRKACELNDCTMIDLLERMAWSVTADFVPEGCACGHK